MTYLLEPLSCYGWLCMVQAFLFVLWVLSSHETASHRTPCHLSSAFLHYQLEGRLGFAGIVVHASLAC